MQAAAILETPTPPRIEPVPPTMTAIVRRAYGDADVLEIHQDVPTPVAGEGEVLVRIEAAGLDRGVWHLMKGEPWLMRIAGFGVRAPKDPGLGHDFAGRVVAVGEGVTRLAVGDEVFGVGRGTFAQYAVAKEKEVTLKPPSLSFEEAASLPASAATALMALDIADVKDGQHVLVLGASGGVGSFAVQLAKARGARVTGVCSGAKADLVRSLGADEVIDYTRDDLETSNERYDAILDIAGRRPLSQLRRLLTPRGTLAIVGGEGGGKVLGGLERNIAASLLSPLVSQNLRWFVSLPTHQELDELLPYFERGDASPAIDRRFSLEETADAIRYMVDGRPRGKVVIVP